MVISFGIFNKDILNLFNLDISSVLYFFLIFNLLKYSHNSKSIFILVCSAQIVDVFGFPVITKIIIIYLV